MRAFLLAASVFATAACSEAPSAAVADAAVPPKTAAAEQATSAKVTDANGLTLEEIGARLIGTFRSVDDGLSTIVIAQDGKFTNFYDGEADVASAWRLFTGDQPPAGAVGPFTPASRYLEVKNDGGLFYYELGQVTEAGFDMFYTARGNMLRYDRVK